MEDARGQLAQLQKEKWNELLGVDADAAVSSGPNLVGEMEWGRLSVTERMAMAQGDESKKLRARLDARQQDRASKLLDAIGEQKDEFSYPVAWVQRRYSQ